MTQQIKTLEWWAKAPTPERAITYDDFWGRLERCKNHKLTEPNTSMAVAIFDTEHCVNQRYWVNVNQERIPYSTMSIAYLNAVVNLCRGRMSGLHRESIGYAFFSNTLIGILFEINIRARMMCHIRTQLTSDGTFFKESF